jgi:hypothetical protein
MSSERGSVLGVQRASGCVPLAEQTAADHIRDRRQCSIGTSTRWVPPNPLQS